MAPGETGPLLAASGYHALLLAAYYMLRPLRDSMGITAGIHALDDLFWFTFAGMLLAMPVFGWVSGRFTRAVFLPWTYVFFIAQLLLFWVAFSAFDDDRWTARAFFVWISIFNLFVVSVFWSFMADLFDQRQAARMFGFIAGGASIGAIVGSALTAYCAEALGDVNLLLVSAAFLGGTLVFMRWLARWADRARPGRSGDALPLSADEPLGGSPWAGFTRVAGSRYLSGIAVFVVLLVTVTTFLYLQQAELLAAAFPDSSVRTAFLARIDLAVNIASVLLQFLLVGRLTTRFGIVVMLACVPVAMAGGFALLAMTPTLAVLTMVMVVRRAGEYAITRPCREMLFTSVDRESKYKAKNFIDTVVYRGGDAMSASFHEVLVRAFTLGLAGIAWVGAVIAIVWTALAIVLGRRHQAGALQSGKR
ncbi:MAG: MFS transporter [Steroidobacteraceae bacterium]|nr:MFS transporter [Steroidobacteraceae bacterium]